MYVLLTILPDCQPLLLPVAMVASTIYQLTLCILYILISDTGTNGKNEGDVTIGDSFYIAQRQLTNDCCTMCLLNIFLPIIVTVIK